MNVSIHVSLTDNGTTITDHTSDGFIVSNDSATAFAVRRHEFFCRGS